MELKLFYRKVQPSEIDRMSYHNLKYFSEACDYFAEEEKRIMNEQKNKK